jgi:hypothetical protein
MFDWLVFQAPPLAVMAPVMMYGNSAGRTRVRQRSKEESRSKSVVQSKSCGIAAAPAITLNKIPLRPHQHKEHSGDV